MDEEHPLNPRSPYAATKAGGDRLAYSYRVTYDLPIVIVRPFNNYGPRQHPEKVVPRFVTQALAGEPLTIHGDGSASRDWLHVDDTATAIESLIDAPLESVAGEVVNVATGVDLSVAEIARLVLAAVGNPRRDDDHTSTSGRARSRATSARPTSSRGSRAGARRSDSRTGSSGRLPGTATTRPGGGASSAATASPRPRGRAGPARPARGRAGARRPRRDRRRPRPAGRRLRARRRACRALVRGRGGHRPPRRAPATSPESSRPVPTGPSGSRRVSPSGSAWRTRSMHGPARWPRRRRGSARPSRRQACRTRAPSTRAIRRSRSRAS